MEINTMTLLLAWVWELDAQYKDACSIVSNIAFFGGLECVGNSFAYVGDIRIRTQRAAVASRRATFLATHLPPTFICSENMSVDKGLSFLHKHLFGDLAENTPNAVNTHAECEQFEPQNLKSWKPDLQVGWNVFKKFPQLSLQKDCCTRRERKQFFFNTNGWN